MLTVAAAAERGVDVLAVPGPVTSSSSTGTNQLLHEGIAPARHAGDVLAAIGDMRPWPPKAAARTDARSLARRGPGAARPRRDDGEGTRDEPRPSQGVELAAMETSVLRSIDPTPTATSLIADRTGMAIGPLSAVLLRLEALHLVRGQGMWWERCRDQ
jgi:predicted Rossmann fold nucleotide-binding protein DprA/Smf involved in DNA uptake